MLRDVIRRSTLAAAFLLAIGVHAASAQSDVSSVDIDRLQVQIEDAADDIADARGRDSGLASRLDNELSDARDEAIYLKVKLRKKEPVSRTDYWALRDRIDDIRTQARNDRPAAAAASSSRPSSTSSSTGSSTSSTTANSNADVPSGTELDVRLQNSLSSKTSQVEDRFEATTVVDLKRGDRVVIPSGSVLRGVVSSVDPAGRVDRKGSMTVAFDQVTINGRAYPIRATVTQALESEGVRGEAGRIGAGAGVGAIIGGILGGFRGALAGILIGGGGTIAATEGKDVELPVGTVLRLRFDNNLNVR